jgi:ribosome biogenesis GTPase A
MYATPASAVLSAIAINRKCFKQGAVPDMDRAAALLLDDFRNGRLGSISLEKP